MSQARWHLIPLVVVLVLGTGASALAQTPAKTGGNSTPEDEGELRLAPVVIDGETLFRVRGVTAHPAERRAREIADRIRALAEDPTINQKSLTLEDRSEATIISASGRYIMAVFDEDASIEQTARGRLAEIHRVRIGEAIDAYRHDRKTVIIWSDVAYALIATVVLLVTVFLSRRAVVLVRNLIHRRYGTRVSGIQHRVFHIVKEDQIWRALMGLLQALWAAAVVVVTYIYIDYVLALFPWTRAVAKGLFTIVIEPVRTFTLGLIGEIPNLIFIVVLVVVTRYVLRLIRLFFEGVGAGTIVLAGFDSEWARPTERLVRLLVMAFAAIVAYPYLPGAGSDAFKGISIFVGIIFSLGSSSLIGNFIAGYSMTYRRTFRIGDRVKVGQDEGIVEQMRVLVTHLRTIKNEELVVPNSTILSSAVVNYSSMARANGLILHTSVGIGYETPWRQVEAMLLLAAARTPGLRRDPAPFILQEKLADYCVNYQINVHCDTPEIMEVHYTELHRNILDVFNEFGVQIMTPSYMLDPAAPKVVPKDQWYAAPAGPPQSRPVSPAAD